MNMDNSFVNIVDLSNEMLFYIFKKLNNFDVLYSMVGVNEKLDNVACDRTFTQSIDLTSISSNEKDNSKTNAILDRFCLHILPRIHDNIECLTVDACFLKRILYEDCPFILNFRYQISELIITIDYEVLNVSMLNLLIDIYHRIFLLLSNLNTCLSSSITNLRIKLHNFDDCLCLLDGRLNQLHTFIVKLEYIHDPSLLRRTPSEIIHNSSILLNNTKNLVKLKCFSLFVYLATSEFDNLVAPLLRRMLHLEKLTLSLRLSQRTSFIDGTHLENSFLRQLSNLHTLIFDIVTEHVNINGQTDIDYTIDFSDKEFIPLYYTT
ncbi:unnamed protein product [Rotaria sordida]|uniref:F-box domain-containing protein n=1 Tax=Rotaria sordida TaxID=392033 RepID=A0A816ATB7_9BILA|nr:unnamed protein product [Rotaria sordida]